MVAFAMKDFGGEIPRKESRTLPDYAAEQAWNCDLSGGTLEGLPIPQLAKDLSGISGTVNRAYRMPGLSSNPDVWLPLPSPYSSVCRSPLAEDSLYRLYWTNPNDGAYWSTYTMIAANTAPYNLGTIQPSATVSSLSLSTVGGTLDGSVPFVTRSYCWTYVDQYGQESAPEFPSGLYAGPPDAFWFVTGLPSAAPSNPSGKNYPTVTGVKLYRTSTGISTGAQFYLVATFAGFPISSPYQDLVPDSVAVNSLPLASASWGNPPDGLDGLTTMPGGMLVGFLGNTVYFCEPDQPHSWPAGYQQSLQYEILGFGVWQQSLVTLTTGFPSTGSGNSPSNFVFTQVQVPEPCISRGSIITDLMGVYYASQNGLVMLNYFGMQNQTLSTMTKNIWLTTFAAGSIIACRHRAQYLAINGTGTGFLLDYSDAKMGVMQLNTFLDAVCVWNDAYTGNAYIIANKKVYLWDAPSVAPLVFRWRSKQFYGSGPVSLGACQISLDPDVTTPPGAPPTVPMNNGDTSLVLPSGINAVFKLYAGPDGQHLILTRNLQQTREIFRLPGGFKAFDWQCEIISQVGVRSIELASTMKELKGV